jgi:ABC-type uncharacterized transport system permease subunit
MPEAQVTQLSSYIMVLMVPYTLAALGVMISGRVGVFNVSTEGVMLSAASAGFLTTYFTGSFTLGLLAGMGIGALLGVIMTLFTNTLKLDQFIVGLTLFIFGIGLGGFMYKEAIGVTLTPPRVNLLPKISIPLLSKIPFIGSVFFQQDAMVYITIILVFLLHYMLYHTHYGLALRSVGENPRAADALGVNVFMMRHLYTILGSTLMGLAGAYLVVAFTGTYTDTIVSGRGWISIAIALFGKWSPIPVWIGALIFAGIEVLVYTLQSMGVNIPYQILLMLPFIVTLLILIYTSRKALMPGALGKPYDREAIEE